MEVTKMSVNGIDVSKWQGSINWDKVKNSGIKFAMVRASYGKSQKDRYFDENVANAQKAGLDTGAYHYCMALSEEEAVKEADFFISIIKNTCCSSCSIRLSPSRFNGFHVFKIEALDIE